MGIGTLIKQIEAETVGLHVITDNELLQLQDVLINMMQEIAEVCEKHNIAWSLSAGSLLGCVRHKGFIPWDDDLDLVMTRRDYEKFKKIFEKNLSEKYELAEPGDENHLMQYPKIYKKGTTAKSILSIDEAKNQVFIDIVILENTYDNPILRFFHGIQCTWYLSIDSVMRTKRCEKNLLKYSVGNSDLQKSIKRRLFLSKFFGFRTLEEWLQRSVDCFSKVKNDNSKFVVAVGGNKRYFGEIFSREKICPFNKSEFSGKMFYIMNDPDYYLQQRYGSDYMTLPPDGQKEKHLYVAFNLNH